MGRPVSARSIEARLAEAGYSTFEAIATGLGLEQCVCGMAGSALLRSGLHHRTGVPYLWQILGAALWVERTRKEQTKALAREDRVLAWLRKSPGSSGNDVWRGTRVNRNDVYVVLHSLADLGLARFRKDGRSKLWSLTPAGEDEADKVLSGRGAEERQAEVNRRVDAELELATLKRERAASVGPVSEDDQDDQAIMDVLGNVVATKTQPAELIVDKKDVIGEGGAGLPDSVLFDDEPERPGL